MKRILACLLALPLTLAACGAQTADTASTPPAEPAQTTETAPEATTPAAATAGRLRSTASYYMMYTNTGLYGIIQKYDETTNNRHFLCHKNGLRRCRTGKAGGNRPARRPILWHGRLG